MEGTRVMRRIRPVLLCLAALASMGAQHRTQNFVISAPTAQIAQQVGQYAEHYRREKAILWLGQEMPTWPQPCPLQVNVSMEGPSGATSFHFGQGRILGMQMEIKGPLDRLLSSVLPHEITHTVFAHHFRCPVPRWADEGGSVLSEDDVEKDRHDKLTRQILNNHQQIPLRRLFSLKDYPREVMCLYAQGFSMSDYLVKRSDRRTFLAFVGQGMQAGWDHAVQAYYGHRNVEELEEAWLKHLRDTRRVPPEMQVAQNKLKNVGGQQVAQNQMPQNPPPRYGDRPARVVRLTVPPAQPLDPDPIVRGAAPSADQSGQRFGDRQLVTPPIALPSTPPIVGAGWQPVGPIELGPPQFNIPR
jgi:hypothetical protein